MSVKRTQSVKPQAATAAQPPLVASLIDQIKALSVLDRLAVIAGVLDAPRMREKYPELAETVVLAEVNSEKFRDWLKWMSYAEMLEYFNATTPEERLVHKGRQQLVEELELKIRTAASDINSPDFLDRDIDEAMATTLNEQ